MFKLLNHVESFFFINKSSFKDMSVLLEQKSIDHCGPLNNNAIDLQVVNFILDSILG